MSQLISSFILFFIYIYQKIVSPMIPARCRYTPTCSQYSKDSILKYGPFRGMALTLKRILKCHPWGGSGYDPVP
jgi:hypothetical protein